VAFLARAASKMVVLPVKAIAREQRSEQPRKHAKRDLGTALAVPSAVWPQTQRINYATININSKNNTTINTTINTSSINNAKVNMNGNRSKYSKLHTKRYTLFYYNIFIQYK